MLDITAASDRWLLNHNKDLGLRLYVETEDGEAPGLSRELPRGLGRWFQQRPSGQYTEPSHWGGLEQTGESLDMGRPQPGMPSVPSYIATDLLRARVLSGVWWGRVLLSGQQTSTQRGLYEEGRVGDLHPRLSELRA